MKILFALFLSLFLTVPVWALEIKLTILEEIEQDTIEAFAQAYHYQGYIEGKLNTESKEEFMIRKIAGFPGEVYEAYMTKEAEDTKRVRALLAKENARKITAWKIEEVAIGSPEEPQTEPTR